MTDQDAKAVEVLENAMQTNSVVIEELEPDDILRTRASAENEALTTALTWAKQVEQLRAEVERLRGERSSLLRSLHRAHHTAKCSLERLRNMTKPELLKVIGQTRVDLQTVVDASQAGSNVYCGATSALAQPEAGEGEKP